MVRPVILPRIIASPPQLSLRNFVNFCHADCEAFVSFLIFASSVLACFREAVSESHCALPRSMDPLFRRALISLMVSFNSLGPAADMFSSVLFILSSLPCIPFSFVSCLSTSLFSFCHDFVSPASSACCLLRFKSSTFFSRAVISFFACSELSRILVS